MQADTKYQLNKHARKSVNDTHGSMKMTEDSEDKTSTLSLKEIFNKQAWRVLNKNKEERLSERKRLKSIIKKDNHNAHARVRMTECHDWSYTEMLWEENSKLIGLTVVIGLALYIGLGYYTTYYDGLRGIDNLYLITATLTTVGLGDISPTKQTTRLIFIIVLPYGLILFAFVLALFAAHASDQLQRAPRLNSLRNKFRKTKKEEGIIIANQFVEYLQDSIHDDDIEATIGNKTDSSAILTNLDGNDGLVPFPSSSTEENIERSKPLSKRKKQGSRSSSRSSLFTGFASSGEEIKEDLGEEEEKSHISVNVKVLGFEVDLNGTAVSVMTWILKYTAVILIGAIFFRFNHKEDVKQQDAGVDMTWVDACYFATVIATTVGYGHEIWAQTFGAKLFLCFYFLFATFIIGGIIGDLSNYYIQQKEDVITDIIINDLTYVHNVDLHRDGKINEAEFVLYKLLQLQQYDRELLLRLSTKFAEYDSGDNGRVVIGLDVPSPEQVEAMEAELDDEANDDSETARFQALVEKWDVLKKTLIQENVQNKISKRQSQRLENGIAAESLESSSSTDAASSTTTTTTTTHTYAAGSMGSGEGNGTVNTRSDRLASCVFEDEDHVKIGELDFKWSKRLWRKAAKETGLIALLLLFIYTIMSWYIFIYDSNQMNQVQGWYFMAATLSTVGFGDFAPASQMQRFLAIFMIPFGLVVLGFAISFARALALSQPNETRKVEDGSLRRIFETLNIDEDGYITKQQFIDNAHFISMSKRKAEECFNNLDYNGDGKLYLPKHFHFFKTIPGRILIMMLKIYGTILIGGIAAKSWASEDNKLTWIDAFYFSCVAATSIGYGDITPTSDSFRLFMIFYMLIATVVVGITLNEALELYLHDIMGERIFKLLIESSTFVHKADIDKDGVLCEAEFIMFKLQQMKKVDLDLVNRLIDHFEEMDFDGTRMLVIGLHIPNAKQAAEMKREVEGTNISLVDAWKMKREKIMKDLGFDENNRLRSSTMVSPLARESMRQRKSQMESFSSTQGITKQMPGASFSSNDSASGGGGGGGLESSLQTPSISYRASNNDGSTASFSNEVPLSSSRYSTELTEIKRVLDKDNKSIKFHPDI